VVRAIYSHNSLRSRDIVKLGLSRTAPKSTHSWNLRTEWRSFELDRASDNRSALDLPVVGGRLTMVMGKLEKCFATILRPAAAGLESDHRISDPPHSATQGAN
jgi:hypothetical protein